MKLTPEQRERAEALTTPVVLPEVTVDLATFRRLIALHTRLRQDDTGGMGSEIEFEDAIYVAICSGVRADEIRSGVSYDQNTGRRAAPKKLWQRAFGSIPPWGGRR